MVEPIDDLKMARVRKAFLAREGSIRKLAERFGVSEGSIKRYKGKEGWDALREGKEAIAQRVAVEQSLPAALSQEAMDYSELLATAIGALAGDVSALPGKSRESSAIALGKLIELHHRLNPPTMRELVWMLINIPGFEPYEFARLLKQEIDRKSG